MVVDKWQESRFSPAALLHHLKVIRENIKRVEWYIDDASAEGIRLFLGDDVQAQANSPGDEIVSFTFNTDAFRSADLKEAFDCLCNGDFSTPWSSCTKKQDLSTDSLVKILVVFDLFVVYSKENSQESKKYVLSNGSGCPDGCLAYTSIFTSSGEQYFELPGKPKKPVYVQNSKSHNSLRIQLNPTEMGSVNITGYKLLVYEVGVLIKTLDVAMETGGLLEFLVEDLQPGMEYSFKVQSVSRAGLSPKSTMSEKILLDSVAEEAEGREDLQLLEEDLEDSESDLSPDEIDGSTCTVVHAAPTGFKPRFNLSYGQTTEYSSGNKDRRPNLSKKNYERDIVKEYGYKRDNLSNAERHEIEKRIGKSLKL
ncbi:hypothetical protein ACHWQZ_G003174 [Mnemiopsis leidyi]